MLKLKRPWKFLLYALLLALLPGGALAAAGKAIFVLGKVTVAHTDGSKERLRRGGDVDNGDLIITSQKGQAQIQMSDGGLIAVRPASEFRVDNYRYEQNKDKDQAVFSLLKGGFRSITGAIGKKNKEAFGVKTVVGTIGIRGTDFSARLCDANCGSAADGLYVGVMDGGVILSNDGGSVNLDPGDYGYASDPVIQPGYLPGVPGSLLFAQGGTEVQVADAGNSNQGGMMPGDSTGNVDSDMPDNLFEIVPEDSIALPSSGTTHYAVASGSASLGTLATDINSTDLFVDFGLQEASVQVTVNTSTDEWVGNATGMDVSTGSFAGDMSSVGITPQVPFPGTTSLSGNTGSVSGSFTNTAEATIGAPDGASMDFVMTQGSTSTEITGSADMTVSTTTP